MKFSIFIPAGPNVNPEFLRDTAASALTAFNDDAEVIIADDSGENRFLSLQELNPKVHVIPVPEMPFQGGRYNTQGRLFIKKARLLKILLKEFQFDCLLCLDDDALVLNNRFISSTEALISTRKDVGILGRYVLSHEFQPVSYERQAELMYAQVSGNPLRGIRFLSISTQRKLRKTLKPVLEQAISNGYVVGSAFIGGAWLATRACLTAITNRPEINNDIIARSPSGDDDLFTLFAYACGYKVYDFLTDPPQLYISWKTLPLPPSSIVNVEASIIHSVRDSEYGTEREIREYFKQNLTNAKKEISDS